MKDAAERLRRKCGGTPKIGLTSDPQRSGATGRPGELDQENALGERPTDLLPLKKATQVARQPSALLRGQRAHLIEDVTFEREYSQESRALSELLEAEGKLTTQIWYGRKWGIIAAVESGREKRVPREVWEASTPEERRGMIVDKMWTGMIAAMKSAEEQYPDELGPWTDFEWGMLNGKLSAIRWVLGDEWDMLDT